MTTPLTPDDRSLLETLFEQAAEKPRDEHHAFVAEACAGKPALRSELLRLLAGLSGEDRLAQMQPAAPTRAGERIGPYELIEKVGEGGMGEVYAANQLEPVRRKVAIKLIKAGMDSRQVVARFEAERQTLAMMDHPNMAKVLDGGSTASGQPYFVMEFIEGVPILDYCDGKRLDTKARLQLFSAVCQAIQHAHQKGIIHRDIKPSNVQIAEHDGVPSPVVIDFGIAKALQPKGASGAALTQELQLVGTPTYMSPEQAGATEQDIDTRSDIYSLGVLLYELLTGTTPFDSEQLASNKLVEVVRLICEETPIKPSTRISSLGNEATKAAMNRRVDGHRLSVDLRGDLDWIVMKCLEKDRTRRYETANALAADVENHLRDHPVTAGPPSTTYRLRKFVRRNRLLVVAASLIAVVLLLGAGGTTWGMLWALDENKRANQETDKAVHAAASEKRARLAESQRAAELQQVADFQAVQIARADAMTMGARIRQSLLAAAPDEQRSDLEKAIAGINFTSLAIHTLQHELFDPSLQAIDAQFVDQPRVQAQLLAALGKAAQLAGLRQFATNPIEKAHDLSAAELGNAHPLTLDNLNGMGVMLFEQGRYSDALELHRQAADGLERELGADDESTLNARDCQADALRSMGRFTEAEPLYRQILATRREQLGPDHLSTLESMQPLGAVLRLQGKYTEAETVLLEALDRMDGRGDQHTRLRLQIVNSIAVLYFQQGKPGLAEKYNRDALAGSRHFAGDDHPMTLTAMNNLSSVLMEQLKYGEAETLGRESVKRHRAVHGSKHPSTYVAIAHLGAVLASTGQINEALSLLQEADVGQRADKDDYKGRWTATLNSLGVTLRKDGRAAEALPLLQTAAKLLRARFGDEAPQLLATLTNVAGACKDLGKLDEAEKTYRELLAARLRLDATDRYTYMAMANLGLLLQKRGQLDEAMELFERALTGQRKTLGDHHIDTVFTMKYCGGLLTTKGEQQAALIYSQAAVDGFRSMLPHTFSHLMSALNNHGEILRKLRRLEEAEDCLTESLNGLRRALSKDHPYTLTTSHNLGLVLLDAGRPGDAIAYFQEAFDGFTKRGNETKASKAQAKLTAAQTALREAGQGKR